MSQIDVTKLQVSEKNAHQIKEWLATRGGVFVWESVNLSNPGATCTTPATTVDGKPTLSPYYEYASTPKKHITSIDQCEVCIDKEVKRFKVGVRQCKNGLSLKVTDAGSCRIRKEVEQAGIGAYYVFDYGAEKNCIIFAPEKVVPLSEYDPAVHNK